MVLISLVSMLLVPVLCGVLGSYVLVIAVLNYFLGCCIYILVFCCLVVCCEYWIMFPV